jgi:hypothetical protein
MKLFLPKIALVLAIIILCSPESWSCSNAIIIGPEKLCLERNGTYTGIADKELGCGTNTTQTIEVVSAPPGANPQLTKQNEIGNDVRIKFDRVGTYIIRYTFEDQDDCNVPPCIVEKATEVFLPEAEFVESRVEICKGDILQTDINFTNASNATVTSLSGAINVTGVSGGTGTYVSDLPITESVTLRITKVEETALNCSLTKVFDSLQVVVLDEPSIELIAIDCDVTNTQYSAQYRIMGGSGEYTLETPGIGSISGDIFTTNFRPSGEAFTFSINTGDVCGSFESTEKEICVCNAEAGMMQDNSAAACASDPIIVFHDKTNLEKRPSDSIIYILHNNDQDDIGAVLDSSYVPIFNLPRPELADSQLYISAVVGPITLENFDLNVACRDVSFGTPVRWFSSDDFDINGKLDVCGDERNRMYSVKLNQALKSPSVQSWELSSASEAVVESQNRERIFLSFPTNSNNTLYYHNDFMVNDSTICRTTDSIEISVDGAVSAPELSKIILWPGDIFASTSDGPCYQWGFTNKFGNFGFNIIEGANEKYFYSDDAITQSILQERSYFVAIFDSPNCEFSLQNCNSIVFFNQTLNPGLKQSDVDNFSVEIAPNPNDGDFRLELKGDYRGNYNIEVLSDIGQRVKTYSVYKEYDRSITDVNLNGVADGLYFIVITNEFGKREVVKTIVAK